MANKAELDPRIEAVRVKFGLSGTDFWELPQKKGTWVAKHAALEVAAVKARIEFDNPIIIEAHSGEGVAVLSVAGVMADADGVIRREWSTGEASPKNNKNAYPWAMAEKRAKDRVILKLIGIHGLVYSEDEMADSGAEDTTLPKAKSRDLYSEMQAEIDACLSLDDLAGLWKSAPFQTEFRKLKLDWQEQLTERKDDRKAALSVRAGISQPAFDHLQQ